MADKNLERIVENKSDISENSNIEIINNKKNKKMVIPFCNKRFWIQF
jgi:hypothetical protein